MSLEKLPNQQIATMPEAKRATVSLCGFFPRASASDMEIFITGLITLLATYPNSVLEQLTNPVTGLPSRHTFLPSLAEIKKEADMYDYPRQSRLKKTATEEVKSIEMDRAKRPSYDELKAKHGPNWGIRTL